MIKWKLLFYEEGMTLLTAEDINLLRGAFLGEMGKFLAVG